MTHPSDCHLCAIVSQKRYIDQLNGEMMLFAPDRPVVEGHLVVATFAHIMDALVSPPVTGKLAGYASLQVRRHGYAAANILVSIGPAAGMAVDHLHMHVIPRVPGDGLPLPWDKHAEEEEEAPAPKPARKPRGSLKAMDDS